MANAHESVARRVTATTCCCLEDGRCQLCDATVPMSELFASPYVPEPGKRELYWCIHCGGDGAVNLHCRTCDESGEWFVRPDEDR